MKILAIASVVGKVTNVTAELVYFHVEGELGEGE